MAYLIPEREITEANSVLYRSQAARALTWRALSFAIARTEQDLTIRKIEAKDLGLQSWEIPINNPEMPWIRHQVPKNSLYGIYKLSALSLDPEARHIKFMRGITGSWTLFTADLSEMYSGLNIVKALYHVELESKDSDKLKEIMSRKDLRCEAYLSEPIVYSPQEFITIQVTPTCTDTLVIVGFVAEPVGVTVI